MLSDYLMHHGVKGMKWGVRKAESVRKRLIKEYTKKHMKLVKQVDSLGREQSQLRKKIFNPETGNYIVLTNTKKIGDFNRRVRGFFINSDRTMDSLRTKMKEAAKKGMREITEKDIDVIHHANVQKLLDRPMGFVPIDEDAIYDYRY